MRLGGHAWTVVPHVLRAFGAGAPPTARPWSTSVADPVVGSVTLRGMLDAAPGADTLVLVVHGLGGAAESPYCVRAASAARERGWATLRLSLRGADCIGEDMYHAGLTADLAAALADPAVASYRRVFVLGFSLGGHVTLRFALAPTDPRVRAVATICAPLDLARSCDGIDRPSAWPYRHHVLEGLRQIYRAVARRDRLVSPLPLPVIERIDTIRDWDHLTVAPRHGFVSAEHYYAEMSVGPRLGELEMPALYVATRHDPMVTRESVLPSLEGASPRLDVRWLSRGGHVGFAPGASLGLPGRGIWAQTMSWLAAH